MGCKAPVPWSTFNDAMAATSPWPSAGSFPGHVEALRHIRHKPSPVYDLGEPFKTRLGNPPRYQLAAAKKLVCPLTPLFLPPGTAPGLKQVVRTWYHFMHLMTILCPTLTLLHPAWGSRPGM